MNDKELAKLVVNIRSWANELGFQAVGIADVDLSLHEQYLNQWLEKDFHGEMDYMARHGTKRSRPDELEPGTCRIISVRMDYLPPGTERIHILNQPEKAYISRYALGRDYHKLMRKKITKLAAKIESCAGQFQYRAFVDSAPVLEKAIAEKAGTGWIGKHTLLLDKKAGSWFFLGELFTNIPLPVDEPVTQHCGSCSACIDICPTQAIVAPYQLDSRKCISYLTIELKGSIPEPLRKPMGNRVFGCDDCQLVCPWNKFARYTDETDFHPRHQLNDSDLTELFLWNEATYLKNTEGSAIRRAGYERWLRNLAVGLGNAPYSEAVVNALESQRSYPSDMVQEHISWALEQQLEKKQ